MGKILSFIKDWRNQSYYFFWLTKYTKPFFWQILLIMILGISETGVNIYLAVVSKGIIDRATLGELAKDSIMLYILIIIVTLILSAASSFLVVVLNEKFSFGIRKQLYEKIVNSQWMQIKKYHTGDLVTRLTSDAGNISDGIITTIPNIIILAVQLTVTFFVLFYYEPVIAIIAVGIAPVAAITSLWLGRKLKKLQVKVQETESAYHGFMQESLLNLLIIKAFTSEAYTTNRLAKLRDERFYWVRKKSKLGVVSSTIMSLTFQLGYIFAFSFGAIQVASGAITFGTMTIFITLVNRVQGPIFQLAQNIPKIVSVLASAGRIIELQNLAIEEKKENTISTDAVGVKIQDITFGYQDDEILFDLSSVHIKPQEFVAIVGESGIGKTTLIRLIMSFMNISGGEITFENSCGEREPANAGTREFISYVPQGNTLFSGTIRENILMGRLNATEEEIMQALKLASADHFVSELPKGLDTVIGERGHGISEGQAQRIAITRALIRRAPFLILDEATSSLDEKTELSVLEGISRLEPRPTCLLITHRKSVLEFCDLELRISDKKIIERNITKKD